MGEVECGRQYCERGFIFLGNVDDSGKVICEQSFVEDKNGNSEIDPYEPNILHDSEREYRMGTLSILGLNLNYYFLYLSNLKHGENAARYDQVVTARMLKKLAIENGRLAGLIQDDIEKGVRYFIDRNTMPNPLRDFCIYYCGSDSFTQGVYDLLEPFIDSYNSDYCRC